MATLDERRAAATRRLARLNDAAFEHVAALEKIRKERQRLARSLAQMGTQPAHLQRARKTTGPDRDVLIPSDTPPIVARRAREPAGGPGAMTALERARQKAGVKSRRQRP